MESELQAVSGVPSLQNRAFHIWCATQPHGVDYSTAGVRECEAIVSLFAERPVIVLAFMAVCLALFRLIEDLPSATEAFCYFQLDFVCHH